MGFVLILLGVTVLVWINYYIAKMFSEIALLKGHTGKKYFWCTFFFGIIGMLMVVALPLAQHVTHLQEEALEFVSNPDPTPEADPDSEPVLVEEPVPVKKAPLFIADGPLPDGKKLCPACGKLQPINREVCRQCGEEFDSYL